MKERKEQPEIRISVEPKLETIKGTEFSEDIEIDDIETEDITT